VDYELRIDGDGVAGRATLTIDTLRDGWTRVEIPSGLVARDARVDGQPVPLVPGDPAALLIARAGRDGGDARDLAAAGGSAAASRSCCPRRAPRSRAPPSPCPAPASI
jgi:hypothetical protein